MQRLVEFIKVQVGLVLFIRYGNFWQKLVIGFFVGGVFRAKGGKLIPFGKICSENLIIPYCFGSLGYIRRALLLFGFGEEITLNGERFGFLGWGVLARCRGFRLCFAFLFFFFCFLILFFNFIFIFIFFFFFFFFFFKLNYF